MINIIIAITQIIFATGLVLFWIYFFLVENKNPERSKEYLAFERSFPIPDLGWLVPNLIISAVGLILNQAFGVFFTIIAGSSIIFLGLLDVSFHSQQGGFKKRADALKNLLINLLCFIGGTIYLVFGWFSLLIFLIN